MRKKIWNKRIIFFAILFVLAELFFYLDAEKIINIPRYLTTTVDVSIFGIATLLIISLLVRFTSPRLYKAFENEIEIEQRIFLAKLYSFLLYLIGFALILWKIGVSPGDITLFLGLIATGIAFAVRDVLMSIFAWLVVLTKKPFRLHDIIKISESIGEVTRIGTFYITLQPCKDTKNIIKLPNKLLLENAITNYGRKRRQFTVIIPLRELPSDCLERITVLTTSLQKIRADSENVHADLSGEGGKWQLTVSLTGNAFDETIQNRMIVETSRLFADVVAKSQLKDI